jgi:arylsulfatase A-like enzyme
MQGFEHVDADVPTVAGRRADELTDAALAWLEGIEPGHPFFLFANYFDPHVPYDPPPGFDDLGRARERFDLRPRMKELLRGRSSLDADERERLVDAYDAEIRFTDFHLGRLLAALRKRPEGDRMLIIVTADHGEAFGEGGRWGHTYWLSQELLHVPLLVRYPQARDAGRVRDDLVQLTDLLPLVAAEVGFAPPARVDGVVPGGRRLGHAQLYRHRMAIRISPKRFDRQLDAAIEWPFLLVRSDRGGRALFRVDGARQRPARAPEVAARLDAALGRPGAEAPAVPASGVDEDTRRALQELGYLE